jgi:hypothetical protein
MIKDPNSEGGWRRGMEREENGEAHEGVHLGVGQDFESAGLEE